MTQNINYLRKLGTCSWPRWVVQNESSSDWLRLRPLGGTDDDIIALIPDLELEPVKSATFPWPDADKPGNHSSALLLRDALRLKLRTGGGPFRSSGNIAVEPRAYQLVPLLMALRLSTVRLLVADDVGIIKTIEAGFDRSGSSWIVAKSPSSPCCARRTWSSNGKQSWQAVLTYRLSP